MTTFQLDECLNSKKLVLGCAQEGLCQVFRFPSDMKGLKDPEMLNQLLPKGNPLITTDFAFLDEHINSIPEYSDPFWSYIVFQKNHFKVHPTHPHPLQYGE